MHIFGKMTWFKFIIELIAGYILVFMFSPSVANFILAVVLVGMIPFFIIRFFMMDSIYKNSINIVDRKFVLNRNALHNDHCTVIYTPDEKIVVMDNIADKRHMKRMFTLTKRSLGINKAWNRLCRIYDSYSNVDSLEAFFSYDTRVEVITIESTEKPKQTKEIKIERSASDPKFVEMGTIQPDVFAKDSSKKNEANAEFVNMSGMKEQKSYIPKNKNNSEEYVNMDSFKEQEKYVQKQSEEQVEMFSLDSMQKRGNYEEKAPEEQELVGMVDLVDQHSTKINVNAVEATELSLLPGINIIMAKKIIEHRNLNGAFSSVDDFLAIANVKEHFVDKIKSMIEIGKTKDYDSTAEDLEEGRIVDL